MNSKLRVVGKHFLLIAFVLMTCFSTLPAFAKPFMVRALAENKASSLFAYDPETGELAMNTAKKEAKPQLKALKSFGTIKNLKRGQIRIYAATTDLPEKATGTAAKSEQNSLIVIQHGNWVSLIDPIADKAILSNIGPFEHTDHWEDYHRVLRLTEKDFLVTFIGQAIDTQKDGFTGPQTRKLFIVNTMTGKVGWVPIREDQRPQQMQVYYNSQGELVLEGKFLVRGEKTRGLVETDLVSAEMRVNFDQKTVTHMPTSTFDGPAQLKQPSHVKSLQGMYDKDELLEKLWITDADLVELENTGNPSDDKARETSYRAAGRVILSAQTLEALIRDGLQKVRGQEDAIEDIIKALQSSVNAEKTPIFVFGGVTGTGKTTTAELLAKIENPNAKNPLFKFSFAENSKKEFVETELFGSKPGYVGSESPTGLMMFMLENPKGGYLLFEEIESADADAMQSLLSFLDKGQLKMGPALVRALVTRMQDTPKSDWPAALLEATDGGSNPDVEITLKLNPTHHRVVFTTNAGASAYNGVSNSSAQGRRLKSTQEIKQANKRFTGAQIKKELRQRGFTDQLLARVKGWVPFKPLLPEAHALVVRDKISAIVELFSKNYRVDLTFTEETLKFLETETYEPLEGVRQVESQIESWIRENLTMSLVRSSDIKPGDKVTIGISAGDGKTKASTLKLKTSRGTTSEYVIGKALPARPTELLARAKAKLLSTLEKRIVGHREELKVISDAIINELSKSVSDPTRVGKPVVIYLDSTPGIGKTEIAKAVSEALFEDPSSLQMLTMNTVGSKRDMYKNFVAPLSAAVLSNPESLVALLDEFPRAGGAFDENRLEVQNMLLSVFEEALLPADPTEVREVNGKQITDSQSIKLPAASIFLCTGNLVEQVLGGGGAGGERMTTRELLANFRLLERHPENFRALYAKTFSAALRSRIGEPILLMPLSVEEIDFLKARFFKESTELATKAGITVVLDPSVETFFKKNYIPMRGARWFRTAMRDYVEKPINSMIAGDEAKFKDHTFRIVYNEPEKSMQLVVEKDGKILETKHMAKVKSSKAEYHPDAVERAAWKTSVHEAGHAIVRRALYNENGSVAEINTFGGGEGGWMEKGFNIASQDKYLTTRKGIFELAVALGGHNAEEIFLGVTANGASADFEATQAMAEIMIKDGSTLGIAPLPRITNPSDGKVMYSAETLRDLEIKQVALMNLAGRIARWTLEQNKELLLELAKKLHESADMHMTGADFDKIVDGRVLAPTQKQVEKMAKLGPSKVHAKVCQNLLISGNAMEQLKGMDPWWKRLFAWIKAPFVRK